MGKDVTSGEGLQHGDNRLGSHNYFLNQCQLPRLFTGGIFSGRRRSAVPACCHLPAVPHCTRSPYWPFHTGLDVLSAPCPKMSQANPPGRQEEFYRVRNCQDTIQGLRPDPCPAYADCSGASEDAFRLHSITSRFILRVIRGSCFPAIRPSLLWLICCHVGPWESGNWVFLQDMVPHTPLHPCLPPGPATRAVELDKAQELL